MEGVALTGSDLSVEHLLRTQRLKTRQVQNWAVGWFTEVLPELQRLVPGDKHQRLKTRHSWVQRHVCVWVFTVFSEEWRRVNSGKRLVWRAVYCSGSSDEDWLDWAPALSPNRVTCIHTHKFCCLLLSSLYDLMSLFWFCKTLQASSGEFSENVYFHPNRYRSKHV